MHPRCYILPVRKLKFLAWLLCLLLVCVLGLTTVRHSELLQAAQVHRGMAFYVLLTLLLAIPVSLVTIGSVYLLELLLIGWSRSSLRLLWEGRASVKLDMLAIAINRLPLRRLTYLLSFGFLYVVDTPTAQHAKISFTHFLPSWGLQVAGLVLLQSFFSYWMHRLEHTIPALWALHKFHHSADRMSILTSERNTQLTKGVEEMVLFLPLALLSSPTAPQPAAASPLFVLFVAYFAYRVFIHFNSFLVHSNLRTDYGWIGRWLLVSPNMHLLHHAKAPAYHDKNFTFDLVIWDRLFGTYASCDPAVIGSVPLGLADNPFDSPGSVKGVLRDYFLTPYIVFWQELRKGLKAWLPVRPGAAVDAGETLEA
jgi:sterol desaturase/sphingolipid hydroxylase (fatty acid hydroxylase superfamily)